MAFNIQPALTIREALRQATAFLKEHGIEEARLNAEWILSHELGCARLELSLRHKDLLPPASGRTFQERINRAAAGEPVQYILGTAEFMGHTFRVDQRCLIPRPETERLVEWILGFDSLWNNAVNPALADVGTGSGCIAISLALDRPEGSYLASDSDPDALSLARENASRHGMQNRIRFCQDNLLSSQPPDSLDAVVSNPPYVRTGDCAQLPAGIRDHEPRAALDGGPDGLAVIRPLIAQAARVLKPGRWLFLEIGDEQAESIKGLLKENRFVEVAVRPDLAGKDRIALARRPVAMN